MATSEELIREAHAALEHDPRVNLHRHPIAISAANGDTLILEGEVASVAAKKVALERTAAVPGVAGVVDRIRVEPARRMEDGELGDHVRDALLEEPALGRLTLRIRRNGGWEITRDVADGDGLIDIAVEHGVVTLDGRTPSYSHKALAGALAWWMPGTRDVVNGLEIVPPQEITDEDITDALSLILEKNPLVNTDHIRIAVRDCAVTLDGEVKSTQESVAAEEDAWCTFGVDRVINNLIASSG